MAFDETPTYSGPIASEDENTPNLLNSFYVQRDTYSNLPTAGNAGVLFIASDGISGSGSLEAVYRDNGSSWDLIGVIPSNDGPTARIATGTYTGDGATSQGITGLGFAPKYVEVWIQATSGVVGGSRQWVFTTDLMVDDDASGLAISITNQLTSQDTGLYVTNAIISLDSDGFTVDDNGADSHPNKGSQVYNYLAIG